MKNTSFSLAGQSTSISAHGLHPEYTEFMLSEKTLPVNSNIPFSGHLNDMEGMVLSFFASLPFSSARNIVELAKELCVILKLQTNSKYLGQSHHTKCGMA